MNKKKLKKEKYIAKFKKMLRDIKEEYKDDLQGLKLFTTGYREMIEKLKKKG